MEKEKVRRCSEYFGALDRMYQECFHDSADEDYKLLKRYLYKSFKNTDIIIEIDDVQQALVWANRFVKEVGSLADTSCLQTLIRAVTNKETTK